MNKYEGKTLEEAIVNACIDKGVSKEELTYYLLEEKQGILFGIGAKAVIEAYSLNDVIEFLNNYLNQYFTNLNMKADVKVEYDNECFNINIDAENNAMLIGKTGSTLQAITSVVKAAASAEFRRHINLLIDVNNYKEERYEKLKNMVGKIAKTVEKTKVSARLGQMTSDERKVVHQYLSSFSHIKTESEGEGANRRLKIIYVDNK